MDSILWSSYPNSYGVHISLTLSSNADSALLKSYEVPSIKVIFLKFIWPGWYVSSEESPNIVIRPVCVQTQLFTIVFGRHLRAWNVEIWAKVLTYRREIVFVQIGVFGLQSLKNHWPMIAGQSQSGNLSCKFEFHSSCIVIGTSAELVREATKRSTSEDVWNSSVGVAAASSSHKFDNVCQRAANEGRQWPNNNGPNVGALFTEESNVSLVRGV